MTSGGEPRGGWLWTCIHLATMAQWGGYLVVLIFEIITEGDLQRPANSAGHYSTGFVLWMVLLLSMTVASAWRAFALEVEGPRS
ncbi:hypothetical protein LH20_04700 [Sphingopyxis sp. 113P3]|nr:hypothetical protein LH20_04700 [Sphingopyxis sp. 113P3]